MLTSSTHTLMRWTDCMFNGWRSRVLCRRTSRQAPQYMQKNSKVILSPMSAEKDERLPKTQDCMHLPSACSARHIAKQKFVIWVLAMCSKWPAYVARSLRQRDNQRLRYDPLFGNLTCGGRPAYCRTVTSDHHLIPKIEDQRRVARVHRSLDQSQQQM